MYLIGFLGSPVLYIFLFGLYLSGFAFFNWKAKAELSDDDLLPDKTVVVDTPAPFASMAADDSTFTIAQHHQHCEKPGNKGTDNCVMDLPWMVHHAYIPDSNHYPAHYREAGISEALCLSRLTIRPPPIG